MLKVDNFIFRLIVKKDLQVRQELNGGPFTMAENKKKNGDKIKKQSNKSKKIVKGRDWTFIVYPESAPKNWREILDDTHLEWVESPLHDKDINPDGTKKKPHWHILIRFEGPVTIKNVEGYIESLNGPKPQKVGSAKGMVRYFAHLDNPEKYPYAIDDIKPHNGADIADFFKLTTSQNLAAMKDIFKFIKKKEIDNYIDFLDFCLTQGNDDWFDIAINHNTLAINKMLDAMWQKHHGKKLR